MARTRDSKKHLVAKDDAICHNSSHIRKKGMKYHEATLIKVTHTLQRIPYPVLQTLTLRQFLHQNCEAPRMPCDKMATLCVKMADFGQNQNCKCLFRSFTDACAGHRICFVETQKNVFFYFWFPSISSIGLLKRNSVDRLVKMQSYYI